MTGAELAAFWDKQLGRWLEGLPLAASLDVWQKAYQGELQNWAFPEPFCGDLLGSPRIVLLANNPGIAHPDLQARDGACARRVKEMGYTAWAATRPHDGPGSDWEMNGHPAIRHNLVRLKFAQRILADDRIGFRDLLTMELYPWHSLRLTHTIRVRPETLREFVLEPLSEFAAEVPVIALGKAWADALDRTRELVEGCEQFDGFHVRSRRACLYTIRDAGRVLVVWHVGSDQPPAATDATALRAIWFRDSHPGADAQIPASFRQQTGHQSDPAPAATSAGGHETRRSDQAPSLDQEGRKPPGTAIDALAEALRAWLTAEFAGTAVADYRKNGRVRLLIRGRGGRVGWNIKTHWLHVWINDVPQNEAERLRASIADPASVHENKGHISFRVMNQQDALELRRLISICVMTA